jgi:hypothetical protein
VIEPETETELGRVGRSVQIAGFLQLAQDAKGGSPVKTNSCAYFRCSEFFPSIVEKVKDPKHLL